MTAGPCAGRSIPELDWEASSLELPAALQAAVWQLEVARTAGAAREHLLGQQELARQVALRKVLEQLPAQCWEMDVSAVWLGLPGTRLPFLWL